MEEGIVSFSDWQNLDLRVGKIVEITDVEGADKLYQLTVDIGDKLGKRTIVAGLKPHYEQEELKDRLCVVFTNLEPKKLKGIESQGMLLAAVSEDESQVNLLQPDKEIELGSRIR
ncbi:MAG: hypothetical protein KKB79_00500 [Nanoarchaeota archaeon]|nr:hypothetical protein [Nanoarchaeota archaeon]